METSRAVSASQASQLGLKEEEVGEGARVCNKCWCNTLKKKHVCQVPSCTSSKRPNRGKLRHLPKAWYELDSRSKEVIMKEMQLPENIKRVCTACFTRITRRISQPDLTGDSSKKKEEEENVAWTDEEIEAAKLSLRSHGTDWSKMSESLRNKSYDQCKKFYDSQRKRLQLDKVVAEYKKSRSDKPSLTSDEESGSSTSSCEDEQVEAGDSKQQEQAVIKPPSAPDQGSTAGKTEPEKKEAEYDSAATMSADETVDNSNKSKPASSSKNISYHDLIGAVISATVHTPGSSVPCTSSTSTSASPSIGDLLNQAPPVPPSAKRNTSTVVTAAQPPAAPPAASKPAAAASSSASDVLDLTLTKPGRESPAVVGHIEQFSYPGISRPPPEPVPDTKGLGPPPPAHGGAPHSKTTHQDIMNQETTLFRKDNKSPAPSIHSPTPGLWPRTVTDPRKELKSSKDLQGGAGPPPLAAKTRQPAEGRGRERMGSIVDGTPHRAPPPPPQHSPRTHPVPSITTGHPLYQPKPAGRPPGQPRPPEASRASQPQPGAEAGVYRNIYQGRQGRASTTETSPSGMASSSRNQGIITEDFKIAQTLKNQPREPTSYPRHSEPHRREEPRQDMRGHHPVHYEAGRSAPRGDPRDQIPVRGDPREIFRDPRLGVDPRADPRTIMERGGRPSYIDPRLLPGQREQQLRTGGARSPHRAVPSSHPSLPSLPPGISTSQGPSRGSIAPGVPKQGREPRDTGVEMFQGRPEVSITKQSHPVPGTSASLADLADLASQRPPLAQRPPDLTRFDPRRGGPEASPRHLQGAADEIERQRAMVMSFNQMSEAEQRQYINALTGGGYRGASNETSLTASTLIEAIITHQISKNTGAPGQPPSRHSPQGVSDGKESPGKMPSRSPSVKSMTEREGVEVGGTSTTVRTSPGTMGEHIENMINKEVIRQPTSSPYSLAGPSTSVDSQLNDHWKRRGERGGYPDHHPVPRPPSNSHLVPDERQILRVSQPGQDLAGGEKQSAVSPPSSVSFLPGHSSLADSAVARYLADARRKDALAAANATRPGFGLNDDYLKNRISEMMKNEKAGGAVAGLAPTDLMAKSLSMPMGPPIKRPLETEARESLSSGPESPRKKYKPEESLGAGPSHEMPDSPESGNMVIDESARPDSAHSHKTSSPAPPFQTGYHGQTHPPTSRPPPANPRYEPLSDDD